MPLLLCFYERVIVMSATAFQRMRREQAAREAEEIAKKQKETDPELEELRTKGKELGVKNWHVMGKDKLQEAITEKESDLLEEKALQELREKAAAIGIEDFESKDAETLEKEIAGKEAGE
jgi:carboxylesterase type B